MKEFSSLVAMLRTLPCSNLTLPCLGIVAASPGKLQEKKKNKRKGNSQQNLRNGEELALKEIHEWQDIIIKPSDKGDNIVLWPSDMDVTEALRQLNNPLCYKKLLGNPTDKFCKSYNFMINTAKDEGIINYKTYDFLMVTHPRTACFYLLPKVHKDPKYAPGRPIVSGNCSLTENASKYFDVHLRPYVLILPSYIRHPKPLSPP